MPISRFRLGEAITHSMRANSTPKADWENRRRQGIRVLEEYLKIAPDFQVLEKDYADIYLKYLREITPDAWHTQDKPWPPKK